MNIARDILLYFSLLYNGDWPKIYQAIVGKEEIDEEKFESFPKHLKERSITYFDDDYPEILKSIYRPPFVLYFKGNKDLLLKWKNNIAVIGTRYMSEYGEKATEMVVDAISDDYVIVSGMAKGIDSKAHLRTMERNGKTIAVLGCSIDECYPPENEDLYRALCKDQLVISERPFKGYFREAFPFRNRIIVGLSKAVIVPEAYTKSGSMTSVHLALSMGREVLCVPQPFWTNSANNRLIEEGATLIENRDDILEAIKKIIW